jgi:hypothetical protein
MIRTFGEKSNASSPLGSRAVEKDEVECRKLFVESRCLMIDDTRKAREHERREHGTTAFVYIPALSRKAVSVSPGDPGSQAAIN